MPEDDLFDGYYQTEYKGPVGHEKKMHKTHFSAPGVTLERTIESEYDWVEIRPGRWRLVKKVVDHGEESKDLQG